MSCATDQLVSSSDQLVSATDQLGCVANLVSCVTSTKSARRRREGCYRVTMRPFAALAKLLSSLPIALTLASLEACAPAAPPPSYPVPPLLVPPGAAEAAPADPHILAVEQRARIQERMAELRVPGVSVAVIDHGVLVWARGYGVADITTGVRVTPETLFQAASISKPLTAMAVMRLVQDGRVGLDDDVNMRLRSWHLQATPEASGRPATIRQLLSHSAGVTVHGFRGYAAGEAVPSLLDVLNGRRPANSKPILIDELPGTRQRYSGGGFVVLEAMLIDVLNMPFDAIMRRSVLDPLGMTHSSYTQPIPSSMVPFAASGHRGNGSVIAGRFFTYPEQSAAGLWTTPSDLALVLLEMQAAAGAHGRILSQPIARMMLTRQVDDTGLGFSLSGGQERARFSFGGSNQGFRARIEGVLQTGQGVVVMTNGDAGGRIDTDIARAVAAEYGWPDVKEPARVSLTDDDEDDRWAMADIPSR